MEGVPRVNASLVGGDVGLDLLLVAQTIEELDALGKQRIIVVGGAVCLVVLCALLQCVHIIVAVVVQHQGAVDLVVEIGQFFGGLNVLFPGPALCGGNLHTGVLKDLGVDEGAPHIIESGQAVHPTVIVIRDAAAKNSRCIVAGGCCIFVQRREDACIVEHLQLCGGAVDDIQLVACLQADQTLVYFTRFCLGDDGELDVDAGLFLDHLYDILHLVAGCLGIGGGIVQNNTLVGLAGAGCSACGSGGSRCAGCGRTAGRAAAGGQTQRSGTHAGGFQEGTTGNGS